MPTAWMAIEPLGTNEVRQHYVGTASSPFAPVTIRFETRYRWVDFWVGSTVGGAEISPRRRLRPGVHVMTFTPTATYYVQFGANDSGIRLVGPPTIVTAGHLSQPTPWDDADLAGLRFAQSNDTLWCFHPEYRPRVLERYGPTSWSLREFFPKTGPFLGVNTSSIQMTPSAQVRAGKLYATYAEGARADFFQAGHVGALFKLTQSGQFVSQAISARGQTTRTVRVFGLKAERDVTIEVSGTFVGTLTLQRSLGNEFDWRDTTTTITTAGTTSYNDTLDNQIAYFRVVASAWTSGTATVSLRYQFGATQGVAYVVSVVNPGEADIEIVEPFSQLTSTLEWQEGAWSDVQGWPAAGEFFDSRLWLVAGINRWASAVDDFENFDVAEQEPADAINRVSSESEPSAARWIKGVSRLIVGSASSANQIRSTSLEEPITPDNMGGSTVATAGCANMDAVRVNNRVLYVTASKARLHELTYNLESGGYSNGDLTRLHAQIAGGGFVELAFQTEPEPRVWGVRADGQLAVLLYNRDDQVIGWSRIGAPDTRYKSVCVTHGAPEDTVWVVVDRLIGGVWKRFWEVFEPQAWTDVKEAHRLHSVITYRGSPTTSVSGAGHLEGRSVVVWADGREHRATVTGGAITLPFAASVVHVGLEAVARLRPGKLDYAAQMGTAIAQMKRVRRLGILLHKTPPGQIWIGDEPAYLRQLNDRIEGLKMDAALQTSTGTVLEPIEARAAFEASYCVEARGGGPATLLGLVPHLDLTER